MSHKITGMSEIGKDEYETTKSEFGKTLFLSDSWFCHCSNDTYTTKVTNLRAHLSQKSIVMGGLQSVQCQRTPTIGSVLQ